jgi:hypothetical protein
MGWDVEYGGMGMGCGDGDMTIMVIIFIKSLIKCKY